MPDEVKTDVDLYPPYQENESEAAYNARIEDELNDCCSYHYRAFLGDNDRSGRTQGY